MLMGPLVMGEEGGDDKGEEDEGLAITRPSERLDLSQDISASSLSY